MRKNRKIIIIVFLVALASCTARQKPQTCTITYVANDGFLIKTAHHKVLVDALFGGFKGDWCDQPSDSIAGKMMRGLAPFDMVDLALVTHAHVDHFRAPMAIQFLKNNRNAILICPTQAEGQLKDLNDYPIIAGRIRPLKPGKLFDTSFTIDAVNIRAMRFDHSTYYDKDPATGKPRNIHADVENLGYLVTMDGFSILHTGDDAPANAAQYAAYGFGKDSIDIALMDRMFYTIPGLELIDKYIHARNVLLMHIATSSDKVFKTLKSRPGDVPRISASNGLMERKTITK